MDFVSDALATGRALRTFTLIDSYTKECLAIEVNTGISSRQVTRVLERVIEERGVPGCLRCDNGPEFTSLYFVEWCKQHSINVIHIQPGKPVQKQATSRLLRNLVLSSTVNTNVKAINVPTPLTCISSLVSG